MRQTRSEEGQGPGGFCAGSAQRFRERQRGTQDTPSSFPQRNRWGPWPQASRVSFHSNRRKHRRRKSNRPLEPCQEEGRGSRGGRRCRSTHRSTVCSRQRSSGRPSRTCTRCNSMRISRPGGNSTECHSTLHETHACRNCRPANRRSLSSFDTPHIGRLRSWGPPLLPLSAASNPSPADDYTVKEEGQTSPSFGLRRFEPNHPSRLRKLLHPLQQQLLLLLHHPQEG
mmetsp:Transcript_46490/g.91776  ORF Transcript_46490/g.91776 Transcript_46490/m.91776 type:complete len:227 (-) Transcript_46490:367-1047(-)